MKVLVAGLFIVAWLYLLEAAPPRQGFLYKATKLTNTSTLKMHGSLMVQLLALCAFVDYRVLLVYHIPHAGRSDYSPKDPQCQLVGCGVGKKGPSGCACDNKCGCRGDCCADFWPVCSKWQSIQMSESTFCVHGARPSSGLVVNPSVKFMNHTCDLSIVNNILRISAGLIKSGQF